MLDSYPIRMYRDMHTMGEEIDMFAGLGWEKKIRSLEIHMLFLLHRRNMTDMLEIYVVMSTSSLHFRSSYKYGGGGCRRSKNNSQKMKSGERMCWRRTLMWMKVLI